MDMNARMKGATTTASRKAFSLFEEFRAFALKGNVIDLAIGVIIGAAFGKIIDSLVKHIIMPLIAVLLPGQQGYLGWKITIRGSEVPYGLFLGEVVNFLIVAFALFIFIKKFLGWVMRQKQQEEAAPPPPTRDQELLTEIRDLLKLQAGQSVGAGAAAPPPPPAAS
jgi:large conductance mechanosensitive channel